MKTEKWMMLGMVSLTALMAGATYKEDALAAKQGFGLVDAVTPHKDGFTRETFPFRPDNEPADEKSVNLGSVSYYNKTLNRDGTTDDWAADEIYKRERYGNNMTLTFRRLTPGATYLVEWHCSEGYGSDVNGNRRFKLFANPSDPVDETLTPDFFPAHTEENAIGFTANGRMYPQRPYCFYTTAVANDDGTISVKGVNVADNTMYCGAAIFGASAPTWNGESLTMTRGDHALDFTWTLGQNVHRYYLETALREEGPWSATVVGLPSDSSASVPLDTSATMYYRVVASNGVGTVVSPVKVVAMSLTGFTSLKTLGEAIDGSADKYAIETAGTAGDPLDRLASASVTLDTLYNNQGESVTLAVGAGETLSAKAVGTLVGAGDFTIGESAGQGALAANGAELTVSAASAVQTLTVNAAVTAPNLIKAGQGLVRLAGGAAVSGAAAANSGVLEIATPEDQTDSIATLSGPAVLRKSGAGSLTLTGQSAAFTGDIEVTGGTLVAGVPRPFAGEGEGQEIRVSNGGTLLVAASPVDKDAVNYGSRRLLLSGAGVDGKGALVYEGQNQQQHAFKTVALAADATVGGDNGRLDVRGGTFTFNGHNLTKTGTGTFCLTEGKIATGESPVALKVNQGTVLVEWGENLQGAAHSVNVADGANFNIYRLSIPVEWGINLADGATLQATYSTQDWKENIFVGPFNLLGGTAKIGVTEGYQMTVKSAISGTGGLLKKDAGYLYFKDGVKSYAGGTEVSGGRLIVADKNQLPGYDVAGKVKVSGGKAGVMLQSRGWTSAEFADLIGKTTFTAAKGYIGYAADADLTLTDALANDAGSILLRGDSGVLTAACGLDFPQGALYASGDTAVTGAGKRVFSSVEMVDPAALTVKDGAALAVGSDVRIGTVFSSSAVIQRLTLENATLSVDPLPASGPVSSTFKLGDANNAVGILDVGAGSAVNHKILGAVFEWSRAAIYIRPGGVVTNHCGSGHDGYICGQGYGFMSNAGVYAPKGWSQVVQGNYNASARAVGVLYNTGDLVLTGENGGNLDLSRGGTGVVYQTSGKIEIKRGELVMNSQHGATRGAGILTVEGAQSVTKTPTLIPCNHDGTLSILTLREGGTLDYGVISPRNNNYTSEASQLFYLNFAGGWLKPQNNGNLFKEGARYQPNALTVFEGGMGVDVGDGLTATLNVPAQKPQGRGIASITASAAALAQDYIGAPHVAITGDGYGATAVALYDLETRRITGIKVTSPGCGYTTATVELVGGRADNNTPLAATATLTDETQVAGGLLKRGAGTLVVPEANLPDGLPLTLEDGVLDLQGRTYHTPLLTLAGGRVSESTTIIAEKIVGNGDVILPANVTLAENATVSVESGTFTVETRIGGLVMTRIQCADEAEVDALMNDETALDWSSAVRVQNFNTANSTSGWATYQVLAYKGYIWNRSNASVTWTFAEHFDDGTRVIIDGETVLSYDKSWNYVKLGTTTLSPGRHTFEVRFAQLGGGAGPANQCQNGNGKWPASTLAFGLDRSGSNTIDIEKFDHLTDLADGETFTVLPEERLFAPDHLELAAGATLSFNAPSDITRADALTISAAELLAGKHLSFGKASLTFGPGATLTITDFDDLNLSDPDNHTTYVLVEAERGLAGLENLTITPAAPKGWKYAVKGNRLQLMRSLGFAVDIH